MKKILIAIFPIVLFTSACDNVLDREPLDIISSAVVWDDPKLVEAYVVNLFLDPPGLRIRKDETASVHNWEYGMYDNLTDQCGMTRANRAPARWKRGDLSSTAPEMMQWWGYDLIRRINEFYEGIEDSKMNENDKNIFIGAVKWLEAFSYYEMGKRYGGVPIIRKAQSSNDPYEELYPARNTEAEVYDHAISKLDEIINRQLVPASGGRASLPNLGAVYALKSRIALYAASIARWGTVKLGGVVGIDPSREMEYWQQAYDAADHVIKSGVYSPYPINSGDPSASYQMSSVDESSPERIFTVEFDGVSRNTDFTRRTLPPCFAEQTFFLSAPYLDFVEYFQLKDGSSGKIPNALFAANTLVDVDSLFGKYDPRLDGSILRQNSVFQGTVCDFYSGLRIPNGTILSNASASYNGVRHVGAGAVRLEASANLITGFGVSKRMNNRVIPVANTDDVDFVILRLTEVILNRAEAAFYLGNTVQALQDVNAIRTRAALPAHTSITDEEQIRYERNVELFFEEIHYFDLKRWRKSVEAISKVFTGLEYTKDYETGKFLLKKVNFNGSGTPYMSRFLEHHYYLPIRQSYLSNNPQMVQNPGYGE